MDILGLFDSFPEELNQTEKRDSESKIVYQLPDADLLYYPHFFNKSDSDSLLEKLQNKEFINWKQEQIRFYGKLIDLPRETAWYGDEGKSYTYSGITVNPDNWNEILICIKEKIEAVSEVIFNSVLLNLYRHERDSVSWHSDDEPELGVNPVIGSVSFGATRTFRLKHKRDSKLTEKIELEHGSFLLMKGPTQHNWAHQIPKRTKKLDPRINLTFRVIKSVI